MKNTWYIFFLIGSLWSCQNHDPATNRPASKDLPVESAFSVRMDHGTTTLDQPQSLEQLSTLLDQQPAITVNNLSIALGPDSLYGFRQNWGDVVLTKDSETRYALLEYYIVPIGSVYGKVALVRQWLDAAAGTIQRDTAFEPQLRVYKYWSNHIVKEYDSYLSDTTFTTAQLAAVSQQAHEAMRYLMYNLTLAAVLEDCAPCKERMDRVHQDFPFVAAEPYYDQNLAVCRVLLGRFGLI